MSKIRLDKRLVELGLSPTRAKAQAQIMAGEVWVDGEKASKAGMLVGESAELKLTAPLPFASRGGYKLDGALNHFGIEIEGQLCADVGACTGGFTDVLLQRGARRVYAIDVGYGQLDWRLRQDARVVVMERTNARYLETLPELVGRVVIDVSFISLKLILPSVQKWLSADGKVIALVKPQFEAGRDQVGKGGIIRDPAIHQAVLAEITSWAIQHGWQLHGTIDSPITGTDGNREFLIHLAHLPA